jgi:hypothetical protein
MTPGPQQPSMYERLRKLNACNRQTTPTFPQSPRRLDFLFLQARLTSTSTKSVTYMPGTFCYQHARSHKGRMDEGFSPCGTLFYHSSLSVARKRRQKPVPPAAKPSIAQPCAARLNPCPSYREFPRRLLSPGAAFTVARANPPPDSEHQQYRNWPASRVVVWGLIQCEYFTVQGSLFSCLRCFAYRRRMVLLLQTLHWDR